MRFVMVMILICKGGSKKNPPSRSQARGTRATKESGEEENVACILTEVLRKHLLNLGSIYRIALVLGISNHSV